MNLVSESNITNTVMLYFPFFAGPQGIVTSNNIKSLLFTIVCGEIPSPGECSRVPGHSCDKAAKNTRRMQLQFPSANSKNNQFGKKSPVGDVQSGGAKGQKLLWVHR